MSSALGDAAQRASGWPPERARVYSCLHPIGPDPAGSEAVCSRPVLVLPVPPGAALTLVAELALAEPGRLALKGPLGFRSLIGYLGLDRPPEAL